MLIVFDVDGTLTINNDVSTEAFKLAVRKVFNIDKYSVDWSDYANDSDTGIINEIVFLNYHRYATRNELIKFQMCYYGYFEELLLHSNNSVTEVDGASDFIKQLVAVESINVALFTGGLSMVAKRKLRLISIDEDLLLATASDGDSRAKIFTQCVEKSSFIHGIKYDRIILFGDSQSDIDIYHRNNIGFVGVTTQHTKHFFHSQGVVNTIPDFKNICLEDIIKYGNY